METPNFGAIIEQKGWRQGSIVRDKDTDELFVDLNIHRSKNECVIVLSHSCDLAHFDLESEPHAEINIATIIQQEDGNFTAAKHPRCLHLRLTHQDGHDQAVSLKPSRRHWVNRERFTTIEPDETRYLDRREIQYLAQWLAGRYKRAALPTAFNDRVMATKKKRGKIHKHLSPRISGLYIRIHPFKELHPHETYDAQLLAGVTSLPQRRSREESRFPCP